jgi:ubiquinone/menaquinone biosynthesis C-methylase UbiE
MTMVQMEKLNLGCGPNAPSGWLNVDGSWNAWFSYHPHLRKMLEAVGLINSTNQGAHWNVRPIVHDLRRPLPFKENTFSAIYASHVLEHLYLVESQRLLGECKRVLKPGGVIRLVVPDLRFMVTDYLQRKNGGNPTHPEEMSAADHLNERLGFRSPAPPAGNIVFRFYAVWKDFHSHKWMYDSESLTRYLNLAGFEEVSKKEFLKSEIPGIEDVETSERILGGAGICIEGRKA